MKRFTLLDEEQFEVEVPAGDILEIIPEEELDDHAPEAEDAAVIEDIGEVTAGLEACLDMLATAATDGSLNGTTAKLINLSVTLAKRNTFGGFTQGLQQSAQGGGDFGTEAFEDKASSASYASFVMLSIGEDLKKIWAGIIAFLRKWFDKAAAWYNKYVSRAAFAKRKEVAIIKGLDKVKGSVDKDDFELNESEAMALTIGGSFNPKEAIDKTVYAMTLATNDKTKKLSEISLKTLKALKFDSSADLEAIIKREQSLADTVKDYTAATPLTADDRFKDTATEKFLSLRNIAGGKMIVAEIKGEEFAGSVFAKGISVSLKPLTKDAKGEKKVKALDKSGVKSLAETCEAAAQKIITQKADFTDIKRTLNEYDSEIKSIISKLDSGKGGEANAPAQRAVRGIISGSASFITGSFSINRAIQSQVLTSILAALNYCSKSLGNHKEAKA